MFGNLNHRPGFLLAGKYGLEVRQKMLGERGTVSGWPPIKASNVRALLHLDGNATDATSKNTPTVVGSVGWETGLIGQALVLNDNYSNYINIPYSANLKLLNNDFCASAWIKPSGTASHGMAIAGCAASGEQEWYIYLNGTATSLGFYGTTYGGSGSNIGLSGVSFNFLDGNWHHVAVTRSGNTFRFFIDGELKRTQTLGSAPSFYQYTGATTIGRIGVSGYEYPFKGSIDEFMLVIGESVWTESFVPPTTPYTYAGP